MAPRRKNVKFVKHVCVPRVPSDIYGVRKAEVSFRHEGITVNISSRILRTSLPRNDVRRTPSADIPPYYLKP